MELLLVIYTIFLFLNIHKILVVHISYKHQVFCTYSFNLISNLFFIYSFVDIVIFPMNKQVSVVLVQLRFLVVNQVQRIMMEIVVDKHLVVVVMFLAIIKNESYLHCLFAAVYLLVNYNNKQLNRKNNRLIDYSINLVVSSRAII